jgi:hypothetical protein
MSINGKEANLRPQYLILITKIITIEERDSEIKTPNHY